MEIPEKPGMTAPNGNLKIQNIDDVNIGSFRNVFKKIINPCFRKVSNCVVILGDLIHRQ